MNLMMIDLALGAVVGSNDPHPAKAVVAVTDLHPIGILADLQVILFDLAPSAVNVSVKQTTITHGSVLIT